MATDRVHAQREDRRDRHRRSLRRSVSRRGDLARAAGGAARIGTRGAFVELFDEVSSRIDAVLARYRGGEVRLLLAATRKI